MHRRRWVGNLEVQQASSSTFRANTLTRSASCDQFPEGSLLFIDLTNYFFIGSKNNNHPAFCVIRRFKGKLHQFDRVSKIVSVIFCVLYIILHVFTQLFTGQTSCVLQ